MGNTLESLKRYDEAIAAYAQAIALRPDEALPYRNRANVLLDLGRTDDAEANVAQAVRLDPEHPYTRGRQGWLAPARGRFREAADHLESAAGRDDATGWRYGLALAQLGLGEADRAQETLAAVLPEMSDEDKANARLWLDRVARLKPDLASSEEALRSLLH